MHLQFECRSALRFSAALLLVLCAWPPAGVARASEAADGDCQTVALWLFDEQAGLYPSSLLTDAGPSRFALVLGRGAKMAAGKFGQALQPASPEELKITNNWLEEQQTEFGLRPIPRQPGRAVEPMTWDTALFAALWTCGEKHLRRMNFPNPIDTDLNLGDFDWTVEFWFQRTGSRADGVVFEVGSGPRGENEVVTRLEYHPERNEFVLANKPASQSIVIPTSASLADDEQWHHMAFTYSPEDNQLRHWVDGRLQKLPKPAELKPLPPGDEAYVSIGRDGTWKRPLTGKIDELRFSTGQRYQEDFSPPGSFSRTYGKTRPALTLRKGPKLLFADQTDEAVIELGDRRHLFIDDALIASSDGVAWKVNPPAVKEQVWKGYSGHLSIVEDDERLVRLYSSGPKESLIVHTSKDGINFEAPDLGLGDFHGGKNVVIRDAVGMGQVFIDPNAPPEERWKYVSGVQKQGFFVFYSPDGYRFTRHETAALPFGAGSQSHVFYDDQRQLYVGYHRSDYGASSASGQESERRFVVTEVKDLLQSWPFEPVTREKTTEVARRMRIKSQWLDPWYLDNGPLAPGGIGIEFPVVIAPDEKIDPPHTDIYIPKAGKYEFAPDAYVAFPHFYFHYWDVDSDARAELGRQERRRGSGAIEVQTMVSRDGLKWTRYPRPVYASPGNLGSQTEYHMVGMAQGMVRRGDEIWQYITAAPEYHSAWREARSKEPRALFRAVQRLDGFVSADFDYNGGRLVSKPIRFDGDQLHLNINTHATGYCQVAILDENHKPIPGFSADECVYINGNFIDMPVEWLKKGSDLSELAGKTIHVEFRGLGCKLYAMQFTHNKTTVSQSIP